MAEVLGKSVSDDQTATDLSRRGITGKYTAQRDTDTAGPFVVIIAEDTNPAMAMRTMREVAAIVPPRLQQLQVSLSVPTSAFITSRVISVDEKPRVIRKSQVRATIAAAGLGILMTIGLVALAERFSLYRRRRVPLPESRRPGPEGGEGETSGLAAEHDVERPVTPHGR